MSRGRRIAPASGSLRPPAVLRGLADPLSRPTRLPVGLQERPDSPVQSREDVPHGRNRREPRVGIVRGLELGVERTWRDVAYRSGVDAPAVGVGDPEQRHLVGRPDDAVLNDDLVAEFGDEVRNDG